MIAIVESLIAAFSRGNVDAVVEHFSEDCVLTLPVDGAPRHGRAAVRDYLEGLYRDVPSCAARVTSVVADGAVVAAEVEMCGRWRSESLDATTTGVSGRVWARVCSVIEEGRIREQRIDLHPATRSAASAPSGSRAAA